MPHCDSRLHVQGESEFVDDTPPPRDMLHAAVLGAPVAHGKIESLDTSKATEIDGLVAVIRFEDIPGKGYIGALIDDEPLFAHDEILYHSQPIALVVAESAALARRAVSLIKVEALALPVVTCPREAFKQGKLLQPIRVYEKGNVDAEWAHCSHVVEGSVTVGGQEHLYLETNRARVVPQEEGRVKVYSSTQSPSSVQKSVASVLGIPMHLVEVDVMRIGGGFGGKEDQATHWACMAAVAARRLRKPVQLVLNREEDMRMTGKRHPYEQDFKIGLDSDLKIRAYQIEHYQNAGAYMDLSAAVLERSILHSTNAYAIPHVRIHGAVCQTNLPPNTAYRGFGAPQGMFGLEAAFSKAAREIGVDREVIQERNLITDPYTFHYGQSIDRPRIGEAWGRLKKYYDLSAVKGNVDHFNRSHHGQKKGYALMPVCFGISFTRTFLNQGSALVHVYADGSVSVASGGVEMGQGISSNLITLAANAFGIQPNRIKYNSVNTSRIANISPSAASSTTDLNGGAVLVACEKIMGGLRSVAASRLSVPEESILISDETVFADGSETDLSWTELVGEAYRASVALMAHGFYATPKIGFNNDTGKGIPFHYYSQGACLVEATVDCLRGRYSIDSAKIVHDLGRPIVPTIDRGQIEGGLAQGLGWVALEELCFTKDGVLATDSLSRYKLPDNEFLPDEFKVEFLEPKIGPGGPAGSKAVGEPPFMYGIAAYFAILKAIEAFREQQGVETDSNEVIAMPMTPERVLTQLYPNLRTV